LFRGINDYKKGYQRRTTIVKDEKGNLVAEPHNITRMYPKVPGQYL